MSAEPRNVGPIDGREVYRDAPDGPPPPPPSSPPPPPPGARPVPGPPPPPGHGRSPENLPAERTGSAAAQALHDIRHSRGRNVANSRPLPEWVRKFAWFLDNSIPVPGTDGRRVGVDGVIAIVPVVGDVAGVVMSMSIVLAGVAAGVTIPTTLRMLLNVGFEALVGLIPVGGFFFDLAFKANMRNVALIERDLADRKGTRRSSLGVLFLSLAVVVAGIVMSIVISVLALAVLVWLLAKIF